ncbi:MAG: hypothetical protein NVS2B17_26390 [Candidatus Velthaea sp.]
MYLEQHGGQGHDMDGAVPGSVSMDLQASLKAGKPIFVKAATKVGRNKQCPCGWHEKCLRGRAVRPFSAGFPKRGWGV